MAGRTASQYSTVMVTHAAGQAAFQLSGDGAVHRRGHTVDASTAAYQARSAKAVSRPLLADGVGFEPTVGLHPRRFSRPVHSTALPPIRQAGPGSRRPRAAAAPSC